jgi:hypothetical protein
MRIKFRALSLSFLLASCTTVPTLQYDGVEISEIVHRVKCELAYAVPEFSGKYPSGGYQWVKYWTAKVDLTLDTNDQSALKPNSSFVEPMSQVVMPGVGTFSRMFTVGAAGELSGSATRNDKLSFTVSMQELMQNRRSEDCLLPDRLGLLGNLGLREWVSSALAPVADGQLTIGYHQPPVGKASVPPVPGPTMKALVDEKPEALLAKAQKAMRAAEEKAEELKGKSAIVMRKVLSKSIPMGRKIQMTYDGVDEVYGEVGETTHLVETALDLGWQASRAYRDSGREISAKEKEALARVATDGKTVTEQITKAKQTATAAWELLPRDPPLDSITHQAKFIVTAAANVTPNWTLVRFRGPGLVAPLASASRMRTNTLDVVLGQPATPGGKALSDEQQRQLFNLQLDSLRARLVPVQVQ